MKTSALVSWKLFLLIFGFIIASCDYESTFNVEPTQKEKGIKTNQTPILAYIETAFDTVAVCNNLELTCIVEDPENDSCTYEWESFKVTEESTEEDYDLDYFMNKGEFIEVEQHSVWEPGKIDGKYLLLCIAKDKAGYEIVARKIVNVNFNNCLSLTTDTTVYEPFGKDELYTGYMTVKIKNNTNYSIIPRSEGDFIYAGIQKKEDDSWIYYTDIEESSYVIILESGEEILEELGVPVDFGWGAPAQAGVFRFFLPYRLDINNPVNTDTLYSNEFKVVE